jgi:hypothetical protein
MPSRIEVIGLEELNRGARRQSEGRLPFRTRDEVAHAQRVGRHERVPLLMIVHDLCAILQMPIVLEIEPDVSREPGRHGAQSVVERKLYGSVRRRNGESERLVRVHRAVVSETRDEAWILRVGERQVEDELIPIVDDLGGESHVSVVEQSRDVSLELTAANSRETGIAYAMVVAIEPAHIEPPVVAYRSVDVHIVTGKTLGRARGDHAALKLITARLVDEVHDRARRIRAEERRAAAAHDLHAIDAFVGAEEIVGVHEERVHGRKHGQSILHEHHVFDAQNSAHADVLVDFTARALDAREPRNVAQHLGRASRLRLLNLFRRKCRDCDGRLHIRDRRRRAGHYDRLELQRIRANREVVCRLLTREHLHARRLGAESDQPRAQEMRSLRHRANRVRSVRTRERAERSSIDEHLRAGNWRTVFVDDFTCDATGLTGALRTQ